MTRAMSPSKLSKFSILSALNETTKQAAKAEAEKKRLAEEAQKAKELKREQQREDRIKKREEKQRLKLIEDEKKKAAAEKSKKDEKTTAEFVAKKSGDINDVMMGEQWEGLSDDEESKEGANKTLFGEKDDEEINSPDYKKGKSTGGGSLKSDWRYSKRDEGARKSTTKAAPLSTGYGRTGLFQESAFVDVSIELSSEDKPSEFLGGIQGILKECQLLTEAGLVELTHQEGKEPLVIKIVSSLPTSYTLLSKFVDMKSENPFKQNWNDKKNITGHHRDDDDKRPIWRSSSSSKELVRNAR